RIEQAHGNLIAREGIPHPRAGCVLPGRERVVNRQTDSTKRKIPVVHLRGRHGNFLLGLAATLEEAAHRAEEEGPIPTVVQLAKVDGTAEGAIEPAIVQWLIVPCLLKIVPMPQPFPNMLESKRPMRLVGA